MQFKVRLEGFDNIHKELSILQSEMQWILAKTITFTNEKGQADVKDEIGRKIDRPTPMTVNSLKKTTATPAKLTSEIWFKDPDYTLSKNYASQHWLVPQIYGGSRRNKRFENSLIRAGIMQAGRQVVPARGLKLDRYGNIPASLITQIFSAIGANHEVGYMANRTTRSRRRSRGRQRDFFATSGKGIGPNPLAAGVWERLKGGAVKPILLFVKPATYRKRISFYEVAQAAVDKNIDRIFNERVDSALKKVVGNGSFRGP